MATHFIDNISVSKDKKYVDMTGEKLSSHLISH